MANADFVSGLLNALNFRAHLVGVAGYLRITTRFWSRVRAAYPNPGSCRLSQMHRVALGAKSHRFIVLTFEHFNFGGRAQSQTLHKFQELGVFFVNAENFRVLARAQIRQ